MRYLLGVLIIGLALVWIQWHRVETVKEFSDKQQKRAIEKESFQKKQTKIEADEKIKGELVKVLVKAKDVRTCLKEGNTSVIDNSIIECNKDHYVEMRRDEAEKLKEQKKWLDTNL
jgi:hypothetical protein